jgi:hypothetical protein
MECVMEEKGIHVLSLSFFRDLYQVEENCSLVVLAVMLYCVGLHV